MKKLACLLFLTSLPVLAQVSNQAVIKVETAPSGACPAGSTAQLVNSTGAMYSCQSGTWTAFGSSSVNLVNGLVVGTGSGGSNSAATSSTIVGLFGACTSTQLLNGGGTCSNNASATVATGLIKTAAAISNTAISYSAAPRAGYKMPPLNGTYIPTLTTANLTAASGLSNCTVTYVDSGSATVGTATGVCATVAGTPGTGYVPLAQPLDITQPGRLNTHLCIGSSTSTPDTNTLKVGFTNTAGSASFGIVMTAGSMTSLTTFYNGSATMNGFGSASGIPSGTCGDLFIDWIGNGAGGLDAAGNEYLWMGWIPDTVTTLNNAFSPTTTYVSTPVIREITAVPSVLASINALYISNASVNSMVTGDFVSYGRLDGPTDGLMPAPGYIAPVVLDDATLVRTLPAQIWIPYNYGSPQGNSIAQVYHPNASTNALSGNGSVVWPNLFSAGYIVSTIQGDVGNGYNSAINGCAAASGTSPYCAPNSTDWGSPTGNKYRTSLTGLVRTLLPNANQLMRAGMSMGALDALEDEMLHPGGAAMALYSPVPAITLAFSLSGAAPFGTYSNFAANINASWHNSYLSLQSSSTGNTPASSPTFWQQIGSTLTGLPLGYMNAPNFRNWGAYNAVPTYGLNAIVEVPYTGSITALAPYDPNLNYSSFSTIPVISWTENQDSLIPTAWSTNFIAGVTAAGNVNATNVNLTGCVAGAGQNCHLFIDVFTSSAAGGTTTPPYNTTTNLSPTLTFFNTYNTPFPPIVGAPQATQAVGGTTQPHNYATVTATSGATATAVAPCTASRCQVTFAGGSVTTGPIFTVAWPANTFSIIPVCTASEQANTTLHGLGSPLAGTTLTGTTVNAAVTVAGASFTAVVSCSQP